MAEVDETSAALTRKFTEFLDNDRGHGEYVKKVADMIEQKKHRLLIDLADLRNFDADLARQVIRGPSECMGPLEEALEQIVRNTNAKYLTEEDVVKAGFTGCFGWHRVSPRELLSPFLATLVNVEGIVTKCSLVRPKVMKSVHYCKSTGEFLSREYRDVTAHTGQPTSAVYPTRDDQGNLLTTEYGLSQYKDYQSICIQEMPELTPAGQMPRSVEVILEDDLVDACKPGDRVSVVGIFKAKPVRASGTLPGFFSTVLIANNLRLLGRDTANLQFTPSDIRAMKKLAKSKDVFEHVAESLAPSIHGHVNIKQALTLLLLGGCEKNLPNGTHLRGDINCLMVGDPGVAKSQMLRAVINIAPLAISTTGRGSSGVGLTAAVTMDKDSNEKRLEAGAMVLADRGIVCIDEFDKMNEIDRVAIHEVMEQQTVTIAKAGIHTTLNARCSVVAAANPIYGSYDPNLSIGRNINLPDSLLSRFDMVFVVLDMMTADQDRKVSEHVLRMHRYRRPGDEELAVVGNRESMLSATRTVEEAENEEDSMYVKYDRLLHGPKVKGKVRRDPLSIQFLKKYLHYSKTRFTPVLTAEAEEYISTEYAAFRQEQDSAGRNHSKTRDNKTLPVTARTLETMIRLASAHAKLRHSHEVERKDAEVAVALMRKANDADNVKEAQDVHPGMKKRARDLRDQAETLGEEEEAVEENEAADQQDRAQRQRRRVGREAVAGVSEEAEEAEGTSRGRRGGTRREADAKESAAAPAEVESDVEANDEDAVEISAAKGDQLNAAISSLRSRVRLDMLPIEEVRKELRTMGAQLSEAELQTGLQSLQERNRLQVDENFIYMV